MPTYRITDPASGRTLRIDGPSPPSEAIVRQMFAQAAKMPVEPPAGAGAGMLPRDVVPSVKGNIDLNNRAKIPNPDGGTSTVYSMSFNEDGKEILVPRAADGRILSEQEAIDRYHKTGQHLGIFSTPQDANAAAEQIHNDYAAGKYEPAGRSRVSRAADIVPMVGGTVGGIVGGIPGAALGGAAGQGLKDLVQKAGQIPGAVRDVARNLVSEPAATVKGFAQGAVGGVKDAAIQGGVQGGLEAAGGAVMKGLETGAKAVYRGYLKPSLAQHSIKDAQQIVDTALREALPISSSGTNKATAIIGELNAEVSRILEARQRISKTLFGDTDLHEVADKVRAFARKKYNQPGRDPADFAAAMKVADNIDMHPSLQKTVAQAADPTPVTLTEANATKGRLYASAGDRAFGQEAKSAATEAEKKGARELKEAIEYRAPAVAGLNARESKLIDAAKAIAHAVEREANNNALVGVKSVLAAGAGGMEYGRTGDPWSSAGKALALRYALTPAVATKVAIVASRIGRTVPGMAPASAARLAIAALQEEAGDE